MNWFFFLSSTRLKTKSKQKSNINKNSHSENIHLHMHGLKYCSSNKYNFCSLSLNKQGNWKELTPNLETNKNTNQNTSSQQTDSDNVWEDKHSTLKLTGRVHIYRYAMAKTKTWPLTTHAVIGEKPPFVPHHQYRLFCCKNLSVTGCVLFFFFILSHSLVPGYSKRCYPAVSLHLERISNGVS